VLPLAARVAKVERGASAADELIGSSAITDLCERRRPDADDWTCAILAGTQLLEIGLGAIQKRERTRAIGARVTAWIGASLPLHPHKGGLPAVQWAYAGDLLASLADPRFDPQRFHLPADDMLGFVHIPADPAFRIGTRKADAKRVAEIIEEDVPEYEINDEAMHTPDFYIARYPVTVAQFRAFVAATGFEPGDADALRDADNRPVRWVGWHEALAYCNWLNETLANAPILEGCEVARLVREGSWRVTLPSELQWEKAARGGLADAVFSWGDTPDPNRANYRDSEIGDTSAVGCFPANGFGLYDMIGNVWEWTRSRYGPYPYQRDDGRDVLQLLPHIPLALDALGMAAFLPELVLTLGLVQPLEERQQIQEPLSPRRHQLIDDPPRRVGLEALDVLADLR
jgi:hypothetical protein